MSLVQHHELIHRRNEGLIIVARGNDEVQGLQSGGCGRHSCTAALDGAVDGTTEQTATGHPSIDET